MPGLHPVLSKGAASHPSLSHQSLIKRLSFFFFFLRFLLLFAFSYMFSYFSYSVQIYTSPELFAALPVTPTGAHVAV